ncbi:phosphatidylethanolamine-binding protein [Aspergillus cavernicola]|uniref:Phosphatidylethanolamine-binding protein n=1 Tax=Aspergillus cavernicola TaxID=176166 RepID=A0ABR4IFS9_9EURO
MPNISKYESILRDLENGAYATLGLSIGSVEEVTPGTKIAKKDTQSTPTISSPAGLSEGNYYTVISLDIDAPYTSWNALSPIMHWIQTDFQMSESSSRLRSDDELPVVPWLPAGPPPGAAPHRYIFLLYAQTPGSAIPPGLKGKSIRRLQRMRFDVDGMVEKLGLGEIVAVNYFVCN